VATFSGVARSPRMTDTGSPGTSRMMQKTSTDIASIAGMVRRNRLAT
jgi:hypothetical protein